MNTQQGVMDSSQRCKLCFHFSPFAHRGGMGVYGFENSVTFNSLLDGV